VRGEPKEKLKRAVSRGGMGGRLTPERRRKKLHQHLDKKGKEEKIA